MIAPIPPPLLYGIWDPEGGRHGRGDWIRAEDPVTGPARCLFAFTTRLEAEAVKSALQRNELARTGASPHYVVESLVGASLFQCAEFTGRN
jgi:hypothetical protein